MGRGALIILEGCDKSGKSTQCKKLVDYLVSQSRQAELWRFPGKFVKALFIPINIQVSKFLNFVVMKMQLASIWGLIDSDYSF